MYQNLFSKVFVSLFFILLTEAAHAQYNDMPLWSYDGDKNGQEHWGTLSQAYAACDMGKEQSPITVSFTKPSFKPPLDIHYISTNATVMYDGHTLRIDVKAPLILSSEAHPYTLKTIVFHSPSEHEVKEKFYLAEIQMLHEDKEGRKLILSVFTEVGSANSALDKILEEASPSVGESAEINFNPAALLPKERSYYAYRGSLTQPPCTEGIEWRILKNPIQISKEQLNNIGRIVRRNARLTQPVYMRTVEETGQ